MSKPLTLVVMNSTRTVAEFEPVVTQAARLKPHGKVDVHVTSVAERTRSDIPPGGSPWHDYTTTLPALEKFFPHPDLAPFLDAGHVERNCQLLRAKLPLLRKHGLGAAAQFHIPWHLPEPFFAKYPHLRGPRVDHPRRSRVNAYAACVDSLPGRSFYEQMFARLTREVSDLTTQNLLSNDAGAGLCWADWQYIGPNGPTACRHRNVGDRVKDLVTALRNSSAGQQIHFDLRGNFSDRELGELSKINDPTFSTRPQHGPSPRQINVGPHADNPVLGIVDAVGILKALKRLREPGVDRVLIDFSCNYSRGNELPETMAIIVDLVEAYLREPAEDVLGRTRFLHELCVRWVGQDQAGQLVDVFYDLHEALNYRAAAVPLFSANYVGVSMRHITRPLVVLPERLTAEEEGYWLPHVFNPRVEEARGDYIDFHGGRLSGPQGMDQGAGDTRILPLGAFQARLNDISARLARMKSPFFAGMGVALRVYGCIFRSCGSFYAVQRVRDRNRERFAGPAVVPAKVADWRGSEDLQLLNEVMREEWDNAGELIDLLEAGGMRRVLVAERAEDEDTFLLGPDLVGQLKRKREIMRRHWQDAEDYLATPHK